MPLDIHIVVHLSPYTTPRNASLAAPEFLDVWGSLKTCTEVHNALILQFPKASGSCLHLCYTIEVVPKPVAAPTNKLFPMHYSGPRVCIPCMAGLRFPALVVKMCFSGPSWQSPLFCRIQPVQMHHPHLRRLVPSRQSACHRPLMHAAHLNPRIQMRSESDEAHHYLLCSPRTLIEAWILECVLYKKYSGCCDMATAACSASYALGATSISTKHYTRAHP